MKKIFKVFIGFSLVLAYSVYIVCRWTVESFGVGIDEIVFTITSPLNGSDSNILKNALSMCLPRIIVVVLLYVLLAVLVSKIKYTIVISTNFKKFNLHFNIKKLIKRTVALFSVLSVVLCVFYVDKSYGVFEYINDKNSRTTIYDEQYIDPNDVNIRATENQKNLIYIYVESMETTYTSVQNGGRQDICYMPNLVQLANENVTFSNSNKIGGFHNVNGTGYTMGSLLATTSGIPFSFPIDGNSMDTKKTFASGLTNLGDILNSFGYNQEFLCGSDATFAGRRNYFTQHGNYKIFDYYTAIEKGYIPKDYFVFWGYEDKYLFEIAKDEVTELAKKDEPFNFTMLTVDTHHFSGYVCDLCGTEYDMQTKNVVSCVDKQVAEFVKWCEQQDFYENTAIIVTGDHPRMDNDMVEGVDYYDRTIYNCFINCDKDNLNTVNRTFTPLDIFPTTLSAIGFEWEGNRLGLGTNMFSNEQTLAEQLGFEYLNNELAKKSSYYMKFY